MCVCIFVCEREGEREISAFVLVQQASVSFRVNCSPSKSPAARVPPHWSHGWSPFLIIVITSCLTSAARFRFHLSTGNQNTQLASPCLPTVSSAVTSQFDLLHTTGFLHPRIHLQAYYACMYVFCVMYTVYGFYFIFNIYLSRCMYSVKAICMLWNFVAVFTIRISYSLH